MAGWDPAYWDAAYYGATNLADALVPRVFVYGIDPLGWSSGTFVVGDPTRGKIGTTAGILLGSTVQSEARADITQYVESIDITTGKSRGLDSYQPGRCTLTLDAADQRFDPFCVSGTAYSPPSAGVQRNLFRRGRRIRVALVSRGDLTTPLFWVWSGFIDVVEPNYSGSAVSPNVRTTVECIDGFDLLGRDDRPAVEAQGAGETLGQRIRRIAQRADWINVTVLDQSRSTSALTVGNASTGRIGTAAGNTLGSQQFTVQLTLVTDGVAGYGVLGGEGAVPLAATTLAQNALTEIKAAVEAEGGQVWINRAGQIQWTTRADLGPWPLNPTLFSLFGG